LSLIVFTEVGKVIEVREEHEEKALLPMIVTEVGIVMEARKVQE